MGVVALTVVATALALAYNSISFVTAIQLDTESTANAPKTVNRTSKELNDKYRMVEDTELKTTGHKFSDDDYNTFSSLTSDLIIETSSEIPPNTKKFPPLSTNTPRFVTRGRYIRNPYYYNKEIQEVEFEDDDHDHAELFINAGMPKWNRFNTNHRQLNKYGPTPLEADITVDEDGSAGYGSTFDLGGGGGGYDSGGGGGGYPWSSGGGWSGAGGAAEPMSSWYSEPMPQATLPVPIIAEIRHPGHLHQLHHKHMSVDLGKIGKLALLKLAAAKLKALGFIKAMLLVLLKLKLLLMLLKAKSLMLLKMLKLALLLPALLSLLTMPMLLAKLGRLASLLSGAPVLVPNDSSGGEAAPMKRRTLNSLDTFVPGLAFYRQVASTESCLERIACRMAATRQPSLALIGLNWALSPISNYIPSNKIRSFVATFTEVTDYRLNNLYSSLLPSNWTEWCSDHYTCDQEKKRKTTPMTLNK